MIRRPEQRHRRDPEQTRTDQNRPEQIQDRPRTDPEQAHGKPRTGPEQRPGERGTQSGGGAPLPRCPARLPSLATGNPRIREFAMAMPMRRLAPLMPLHYA